MSTAPSDEVIGYAEFVDGVRDGTVKYEVIPRLRAGTNYPLLKGFLPVLINSTLTLLAFVVPFIAIPVICYLTDRWILLLGFIPVFIALRIMQVTIRTSKLFSEFMQMTLIAVVLIGILWFFLGPLHLATFLGFCFLFEYLVSFINNSAYYTLTTWCLMKDLDHFYDALEHNRIRPYRVP